MKRVVTVILISVLCVLCGCANTSSSSDTDASIKEYVYSNEGIQIIKTDGWEEQDASAQGEGAFIYTSDNGVINIYFRQIDGMTDEELKDYMANGLPSQMKASLESMNHSVVQTVASSVGINGKEFPGCLGMYEYNGYEVEEVIFAQLTDQGIMMIDITAFKELKTPDILELIEYNN